MVPLLVEIYENVCNLIHPVILPVYFAEGGKISSLLQLSKTNTTDWMKKFFKSTTMDLLTDEQLELQCGEKILQNLDKQLKAQRHNHQQIGRLLTIRHFVSTQVLRQAN